MWWYDDLDGEYKNIWKNMALTCLKVLLQVSSVETAEKHTNISGRMRDPGDIWVMHLSCVYITASPISSMTLIK